MSDIIKNNPAAFIAALRGLAMAVFTFAAAFGLHVTPEQQSAIVELGGALTAIALLFSVVTIKTTVPKAPTPEAPPAAIQQPPAP